MNVAIRADASTQMGSGHIMRCLSLAQAMRERDIAVTFICREHPGNLIGKIQTSGFDTVILPLNDSAVDSTQQTWIGNSIEADAQETLHALQEKAIPFDWMVVDHYFLEQTWESRIRSLVKHIMVIDDLANRHHDCDLLLDQNFYSQAENRYRQWVHSTCKQLIGPDYALLRKQFLTARSQLSEHTSEVHRILVFFGGADLEDETGKTLEALQMLESAHLAIDVVVGASNPNWSNLQAKYGQTDNMVFHRNVEDMAELMAKADLAIGAGGSTTWERCCLGVPSIAWPIAENQKELLENVSRLGAVYCPDSNAYQSSFDLAHIIYCIIHSPDLRAQIRQTGQKLVDGKGLHRVIGHLFPSPIRLREASNTDSERIYNWRNAPSIRAVSINTDEIPFSSHEKWLASVLSDPSRLLLIAEADQIPVGVIRYDLSGNSAEVSIFLAPEAQGKGYGRQILTEGEKQACEKWPQLEFIRAIVMEKNIQSRKLFLDSGFEQSSRQFIKSLQA